VALAPSPAGSTLSTSRVTCAWTAEARPGNRVTILPSVARSSVVSGSGLAIWALPRPIGGGRTASSASNPALRRPPLPWALVSGRDVAVRLVKH
jgi:hypothetical protein